MPETLLLKRALRHRTSLRKIYKAARNSLIIGIYGVRISSSWPLKFLQADQDNSEKLRSRIEISDISTAFSHVSQHRADLKLVVCHG